MQKEAMMEVMVMGRGYGRRWNEWFVYMACNIPIS